MHVRVEKLPIPERNFIFHNKRRWKADFCWPDLMLIVEIDGLTKGQGGRHQRLAGYTEDCVKLNTATVMGYAVLRFTTAQVKSGYAIKTVKEFVSETVAKRSKIL